MFTAYPRLRYGTPAGAAHRDPYTLNARREVAAIAGRVLAAIAVVATFAGSLAYLTIRVLTS